MVRRGTSRKIVSRAPQSLIAKKKRTEHPDRKRVDLYALKQVQPKLPSRSETIPSQSKLTDRERLLLAICGRRLLFAIAAAAGRQGRRADEAGDHVG